MESKNKLTLLDIMEIGLIRKKVLQNILLFSDISNLSKTCTWINLCIQNESIKRNMMWYQDYQYITIEMKKNFERNSSNLNELPLDDIEFEKNKRSYKELDDGKTFLGEVIFTNGRINFRFFNAIRKLNGSEHSFFAKKLVEEMNLNCQLRKDVKCLFFWNDLIDEDINLHIIGYMKHSNIRSIEVPHTFLFGKLKRYKEINGNIFEGLPKFNKLIIRLSIPLTDYDRVLENRDTIEYVMKDLSKRSNPTLVLYQTVIGNSAFVEYVKMIYEIAKKYNITVKYKIESFIKPAEKLIPIIKRCNYYSLGKLLTSFICDLSNSIEFYDIMKNLQYFVNLENFQIDFHFFDIKKDFENIIGVYSKNLSFKHCKKLKSVTFKVNYYKLSQIDNLEKEEIIQKNLVYLASLMPNTVEILKLENFPNLTKNVVEVLSEYMPNIRLMEALYVSYKDPDSLNAFKNLQYLRCISKGLLTIPKTVKLFSIRQYECKKNENSKRENKELLKTYSESFSKCLKTRNEEYIFFENIIYWDMYKWLIQYNSWHLF